MHFAEEIKNGEEKTKMSREGLDSTIGAPVNGFINMKIYEPKALL